MVLDCINLLYLPSSVLKLIVFVFNLFCDGKSEQNIALLGHTIIVTQYNIKRVNTDTQ